MAAALGSERLGRALALRAARRRGAGPEARVQAGRTVLSSQGPIAAWLWMREGGSELPPGAPRETQAAWLALHASVAGCFRDFDSSSALLRAAERLAPGHPDVALARAGVLVQRDRRREALDAARSVLRRDPRHVPAVQMTADTLLRLGRGDEACDLLSDAAVATEDSRVLQQLAAHLTEQHRFAECLEWLDRLEVSAPLLDRDGRHFLDWTRASARARLQEARTPAARASMPPDARGHVPRRVLLPVPFVQQDRFSCSPATLAQLAAFWKRPIDHASVAEEICYHGTARHRARAWAEARGFVVREFRVTWDSARAVLDRGVPFALVTKWGLAGHDQAVVGYDERRSTLLIRCPSRAFLVEVPREWFFATEAWCGPRGTIVVPHAEARRLEGLVLPDTAAWDDVHALQLALSEHRRADAVAAAARLARREPANELNLWARRELAEYDSDHAAVLECVEALLRLHPGNPALALWRILALQHLASPSVCRRILAATCRRYRRDHALHALLGLQLSHDTHASLQAEGVLRRVMRGGYWATSGWILLALANTRAASGRSEDAAELVRLAAHADDMEEWVAMAYFDDAQKRGRTEEALAFLRERVAAYGRVSGRPAASLFAALDLAGDARGAFDVLGEARRLRPEDDDLLLFAARAHARAGHREEADALLAEAEGRTHPTRWLRAAAAIASHRGRLATSLRHWRAVLEVEPHATDAHQAVAEILTELGRPSAAEAHLRRARNRFPRHHDIVQLAAASTS